MSSSKEPCVFTLNKDEIVNKGLKVYFANAKHIEGNTYTSVSTSRLFAVATSGKDLEEIKKKVYAAMDGNVDTKLDYRRDIGNIYIH